MSKKLKNLLKGAASIFEIYPNTSARLRKRFLERTDAEALYSDWQKIGNDIRRTTEKYERESTP